MKLKLTKKQWAEAGVNANWLKYAALKEWEIPFEDLIKDFPLETLEVIEKRILKELELVTHETPSSEIENAKRGLESVRALMEQRKSGGTKESKVPSAPEPVWHCKKNNCKVVGHLAQGEDKPYEYAAYMPDGSFLDAFNTLSEAIRACSDSARQLGYSTGIFQMEKKAMTAKLTKKQWLEIGEKTGWVRTADIQQVTYQQIFDEQLAKTKDPRKAAEMVLDVASGGTWAIKDQDWIDNALKTIIQQFGQKKAKAQAQMQVGDIVVWRGNPPGNNPYRDITSTDHLSGTERSNALLNFYLGKDTSGLTFWHAPAMGGARQLFSPEGINWNASGIPALSQAQRGVTAQAVMSDKITVVTDPSYAPGCFIICRVKRNGHYNPRDEENTILVQTDWDFPGLASTFGWSVKNFQLDPQKPCEHPHTDGTVKCELCGAMPGDFISSARDWLENNEGKKVEDPGYFDGR